MRLPLLFSVTFLFATSALHAADKDVVWVKSAKSGNWSDLATWDAKKVPAEGARVQILPGHTVTYDTKATFAVRIVHVAGTLTFATDKDTRLDVGLLKIQPGTDCTENGFDCDDHAVEPDPNKPRPSLLVGSVEKPIDAKYSAVIRLVHLEGMNKETCPAVVCCGGRMDFYGSPLSRSWVKLGATAKVGDTTVKLSEGVKGWKVGDKVIVTGTTLRHADTGRRGEDVYTEERTIKSIDGETVTLNEALKNEHLGDGEHRAEIANLSRNVVVESADPKGVRGHTMYHRYSAGSIHYAEFRHLGKENILGKYAIHFHLIGDTMRGSSIVGASIWDSHNRWVTIHGTNYLVVRDCVGYKSVGHGYFFEDGTEVFNVVDRCLAVQAFHGKPLPKQVLPFDGNEGAGFWWSNSLNTFTRNVACENDRYGYRYEATPSSRLKLNFDVQQPDGKKKNVDIRTLPFVRFEDNETHHEGLYGCNLGEGVARVGPDAKHPFIVKNMKIWGTHYAFRPQVPSLLVENLHIWRAAYGVYHPNYDNHVYRNVYIGFTNTEPFNRGHDDLSAQYGALTVDGLTFDGIRSGSQMPLVQISDDNPTGNGVTHFRNVKINNWSGDKRRALVNLGGGPRPTPKSEKGVNVYLHDWFGQGKHAQVVSIKSPEYKADTKAFREESLLTGDESRMKEISNIEFPKLLDPFDDLPPTTVITSAVRDGDEWIVRGASADNGTIKTVKVNGQTVKAIGDNFAEWEIRVKLNGKQIKAEAEDAAGNVEKNPHNVVVQ